MLETVTATRFHRRMTRGRTGPFLLECEHAGGQVVEVVAKFTGPQLTLSGLVREALCAMLAADLGLPVPGFHAVELSPEFLAGLAQSHAEEAAFLLAASNPGFGSCKLPPGYIPWMPGRSIPRAMVATAAEIYAFDLLVQNPDRKPDNPNLLHRGEQFAIFDHELALITEGVLFWRPPWEPGSLSTQGAPAQHVLHAGLKGTTPDLARLTGAWETITDERLAGYGAALPPSWTCAAGQAHTLAVALQFLQALRNNLRPAVLEITRTLA